MSQKRNKTVLLISILLVAGLIIIGATYYNKKAHVVTLDSRAFQDNFKGYGTVYSGDHLDINIPLQLIASQYSLRGGDILCFTIDPALSSLKIEPIEKVNTFAQSFCLKNLINTNYTINMTGTVPYGYSNKPGKNKRIILSIWKKDMSESAIQRFNQLYVINKKGQKVYFKGLGKTKEGMPLVLKTITLFSVK